MEDPFIRAYDHAAYVSPDLEGQGVRHCNVPDSFFRLWGLDEFSAIDDLEVRTDRNDIPIYGRRHEGQELAFPKAAVEQDVEGYFIVQGDYLLPELLVLVMRPDVHFIGLGPSDQAGNSTRIDLKPIIFYCIVENRGQLCVNGPKISINALKKEKEELLTRKSSLETTLQSEKRSLEELRTATYNISWLLNGEKAQNRSTESICTRKEPSRRMDLSL